MTIFHHHVMISPAAIHSAILSEPRRAIFVCTGTETLDRLKTKTEPYRRLRRDGGPDYPVLIWLPNPTREANVHRKLNGQAAHLGITLATTTRHAVGAHPDGITGPIWKIAGNGRQRHRLIDLPSSRGQAGPYHPEPPTAADDPLFFLHTALPA